MSWMLVSDSTCEIFHLPVEVPDVAFSVVPMKIRLGQREFVDNSSLDVPYLMKEMANFNGPATTACPSPEEWIEEYKKADKVIAFTITHTLSGSYSCACAARDIVLESDPDKQIFVLDTLSCGGEIAMIIEETARLISEGLGFEAVCDGARLYAEKKHLLFALASYENLVKNGRMNPMVGFLAGKLNMRCLGRASDAGELQMFFKTRGETRVLARILEEMDIVGYDGKGPVVISHNNNPVGAGLLKHGILNKWPEAKVSISPCAGLCGFYEQDQGMIIGY